MENANFNILIKIDHTKDRSQKGGFIDGTL